MVLHFFFLRGELEWTDIYPNAEYFGISVSRLFASSSQLSVLSRVDDQRSTPWAKTYLQKFLE